MTLFPPESADLVRVLSPFLARLPLGAKRNRPHAHQHCPAPSISAKREQIKLSVDSTTATINRHTSALTRTGRLRSLP